MTKWRKKPVVVEARQINRSDFDNVISIAKWCEGLIIDDPENPHQVMGISTLEGVIWASDKDFIIKGVQGEYYPCKPDIFEQTYELAD